VAKPQEPVATTSTPVRITDTGKAAEEEPVKPNKGTSITVKSAGQSITIEVHGDDSKEAVAQTTATAALAAATSTSEVQSSVGGAIVASTTTEAARSTSDSLQPVPEEPSRPLAPLIPRPQGGTDAADGEPSTPDCTGDEADCGSGAVGAVTNADDAGESTAQAEGDTANADSYANLAIRAR